jgi:hypothetical protein
MDSFVQTRQVNYELDEGDDLYFKIYCFFRDWNNLREYLQEWQCGWTDGIISLACVSLMTNTASKLLQRSERELLFQIHRDSGLTDYQSMANLQFSDIGLDHVDYDKVGNEDYGESSEEIYGVSLSIPTPFLFLGCQYANLPPSLGSRLGLPFPVL